MRLVFLIRSYLGSIMLTVNVLYVSSITPLSRGIDFSQSASGTP